MSADIFRAQLPHTLKATHFPFLGKRYQGKVRDIYSTEDRLVLIATDRLSAFDCVLTTIPFKGEVLNRLAQFWFERTKHVVENHLVEVPDACVTIARRATPLPLEFIVRGYMTGSLWRDYEAGRDVYQLQLPPGFKRDEALASPVLTASTKAQKGQHDEPISEAQLLRRGMLSPRNWQYVREVALALFAEGQKQAKARGLILVDTKYEFGLVGNKLILIDEIHTPDSSRYWEAETYQGLLQRGAPQKMLDKENIRQWLMDRHGFRGEGPIPFIPDEVRVQLTEKYVSLHERMTGHALALHVGDVTGRLENLFQGMARAS